MARKRSNLSIGSIINITLILFFIGIFFFIGLSFNLLINTALENQTLKVILTDQIKDQEGLNLTKKIKHLEYVKSATYVSKEKAVKALGDDFLSELDNFNPLPSLINIQLKNEYMSTDNVRKMSKSLMKMRGVKEVRAPMSSIEALKANSNVFKVIAISLGTLLVFMAIFLITNTIRISIHNKRLLIRSMQLIGATSGFIKKPFYKQGITQGVLGGVLADVLLFSFLFGITQVTQDIIDMTQLTKMREIVFLYISLIIFGLLIGWLSSNIAVNRFLFKKLDDII